MLVAQRRFWKWVPHGKSDGKSEGRKPDELNQRFLLIWISDSLSDVDTRSGTLSLSESLRSPSEYLELSIELSSESSGAGELLLLWTDGSTEGKCWIEGSIVSWWIDGSIVVESTSWTANVGSCCCCSSIMILKYVSPDSIKTFLISQSETCAN